MSTTEQAVTVAQEDREQTQAFYAACDASMTVDDQELLDRYFARHRLASVSSASADFVLVPRVPTDAMLRAGQTAADDHRWKWCGYGPREPGQGLDGMMFHVREAFTAMITASPEPVPATNQAGEVEPIADDEALEAISDRFNGSDLYGRTEAWAEGKTLSILFKETGQIAKLRFVKLVDKPSNADLRGEPA